MKALHITRSTEWWEYKLPPLLAVGYATTLRSATPLLSVAPKLVLLLLSLVAGAVYVSIINDVTDIREDLASGKKNRVAGMSKVYRIVLPVCCVLIGYSCFFLLHPDRLSLVFYSMAWIAFSLYSIPPVRLKKRGIWGVFADASGSHLFPSCLIASLTMYLTHQAFDPVWLLLIAVWAFFYGLRGILWHQFFDRENDLVAGVTTFASKINPAHFRKCERGILLMELVAFTGILVRLFLPLAMVALVLYLVLIVYRLKRFGVQIISIIAPQQRPFQIFMAEYYQVFWPLCLLFTASLIHWQAIFVLVTHLLLFHKNLWIIVKDYWRMLRQVSR